MASRTFQQGRRPRPDKHESSRHIETQVDESCREPAAEGSEPIVAARPRSHGRGGSYRTGYARAMAPDTTTLMEEIRWRKEENNNLKKELERRMNELREYEAIQEGLQRRLDSTQQLLDTRTSELKAAQTFMSTEDSRSIADVVQLVRDLNSEIVQASALLTESLSFEVFQSNDKDIMTRVEHDVSESMGPLTLGLLKSVKSEEDMELLGVVFRGCIAGCAYEIITSWHFSLEFSPASSELDQVYEKIYSQEAQAVAGTWRALTRRNLQRALHSGSDIAQDLSLYIATNLSDVILCARLGRGSTATKEVVIDKIGNKLRSVSALAHKLNKIMGEEITSTDLTATWVHHEDGYNSSIMDDASNEGNQHRAAKANTVIICTTELGLSGSEGKRRDKIVLKPKVVLEGCV